MRKEEWRGLEGGCASLREVLLERIQQNVVLGWWCLGSAAFAHFYFGFFSYHQRDLFHETAGTYGWVEWVKKAAQHGG